MNIEQDLVSHSQEQRPRNTTRRNFLRVCAGVTGGVLLHLNALTESIDPPINTSASNLPQEIPLPQVVSLSPRLRTIEEAVVVNQSRLSNPEQAIIRLPENALEKKVNTQLLESRIGLVNGHFWPGEDVANFAFPVSPHLDRATFKTQEFPLFINNQKVLDFYGQDTLKMQSDFSDHTVWAMQNGRRAFAVVETDYLESSNWFNRAQLVTDLKLLAQSGVSGFIVGNEPNDPYTPWRNSLSRIYADSRLIWETVSKLPQQPQVLLPGLAYWGDETYLKQLLIFFKQQGSVQNMVFPFSGVADHFYGSVDDLLPRIRLMRQTINQQGFKGASYNLTEVGDPGINTPQFQISERQRAEEFIPQVLALACASKVVQEINWYAFYTGNDGYSSLVEFRNGRFSPKQSYQSYANTARLLSRIGQIEYVEEDDISEVHAQRTDGIEFKIVWLNTETEKAIPVPAGFEVFDALGNSLEEETETLMLKLEPRSQPFLTGKVRFLIRKNE
jgi:hypothetical protein